MLRDYKFLVAQLASFLETCQQTPTKERENVLEDSCIYQTATPGKSKGST